MLAIGFFTSSLTDMASCLSFLLSVLSALGKQSIFYHANNYCATNLFPSFFFHCCPFLFLFCLLQEFISVSVILFPYSAPILLSASAPYVPCPAYSLCHTIESSFLSSSLYFPLLFCCSDNKSLNNLSVNMFIGKMTRENTQFLAGQCGFNWYDQLAVYLICRKLQRYLSCSSAMVLPIP